MSGWREMRNRRRRIADRVFAFSRREDRDRALMSGCSRGMDALVQNWRSGEDARNQQRERAGQCKQFSAGTGARVPLFIRWPNCLSPREIDKLIVRDGGDSRIRRPLGWMEGGRKTEQNRNCCGLVCYSPEGRNASPPPGSRQECCTPKQRR